MACCPWRSTGGKFTGSRKESPRLRTLKLRGSPNGTLFVGSPAG